MSTSGKLSPQIIDNLDDPEMLNLKSCVVLYSGGVDGSYLLSWAAEHGLDVVALNIGLEDAAEHAWSAEVARTLGVPYVFQNRTAEFVTEYVAAGVRGNALYQGLYPVCSSLSRPLLAKAALDLAHERGAQAVVHTSTFMQNSAARFCLSLLSLDPEIQIVAPFLNSQLTREHKLHHLAKKGITFEHDIYSIDQNLWGRVIECGSLESPENHLPDSGVFQRTRDLADTPESAEVIELEFQHGVPISLDGQRRDLQAIITALNAIGGRHGVGRFSGLEDITFMVKNHEIREAPAAAILLKAHKDIESAVLSQSELSLKLFLDNHWVNLIVAGSWFSDVASAIRAFTARMSDLVNGKIRLKLHKGNIIVLNLQADSGLYYAAFSDDFNALMKGYSFSQYFQLLGLPQLRRAGPRLPETIEQEKVMHHD